MAAEAITAENLVKPPQQERSRKTLARIVKAALELIEQRGVDGASVQDIARRARASVGTFYARFEGKDDLLKYLEVQLWADAEATWREALETHEWGSLSFEELVSTVVHILIEVDRAGARQRRLIEHSRGPGTASEVARAFEARLSEDIRELLLRHASRIEHPDPSRAVDVCLAVVAGTLRHRDSGRLGMTSLGGMDDAAWATELTHLCLAFLGGSSASTGSRSQMDFFEIWG